MAAAVAFENASRRWIRCANFIRSVRDELLFELPSFSISKEIFILPVVCLTVWWFYSRNLINLLSLSLSLNGFLNPPATKFFSQVSTPRRVRRANLEWCAKSFPFS